MWKFFLYCTIFQFNKVGIHTLLHFFSLILNNTFFIDIMSVSTNQLACAYKSIETYIWTNNRQGKLPCQIHCCTPTPPTETHKYSHLLAHCSLFTLTDIFSSSAGSWRLPEFSTTCCQKCLSRTFSLLALIRDGQEN